MATVSEASLVARVRHELDDEPFESFITADPGAGAVVAVADGTDWDEGDIVEFPDGAQARVRSVAANNLTVKRDHNNTTMAATYATNAVVLKITQSNYQFVHITEALRRTVETLWPDAWKAVPDTVTPDTTTVWFDLAADALDLVSAVQRWGSANEQAGSFGTSPGMRPIQFNPNLPTALVTSGKGLRFPAGFYHETNVVSIKYRALITLSASATDVEDGLMAETVIIGACHRLLGARGIHRLSEDVSESDTGLRPSEWGRLRRDFRDQFSGLRARLKAYLSRTIPPMAVWEGP